MKLKKIIVTLLTISTILMPGGTRAITPEDQAAVDLDSTWYDANETLIKACSTAATTSAGRPVIAIDPGHGSDIPQYTDTVTGLADRETNNMPEGDDVLDVGNRVKTALETAGYTVVMLRNASGQVVNKRARVDAAIAAHANLVVSLHTTPGAMNDVWPQRVGSYREFNGTKVTLDNSAVAAQSQTFATAIATARQTAEGHPISQDTDLSHEDGSFARGDIPSKGNISLVQLWGQAVPWVYNEIGQDSGTAISEDLKAKYADGLIKGIEAAVPATTTGTVAAGTPTAPALPAGTTVDQKIAQTFIVGFSADANKDTVKNIVTKYHLGGVFVVGTHDAAAAGWNKGLTDSLNTAAGIPLTFASDEEGGQIANFAYAGAFPSAKTMGTMETTAVKSTASTVATTMGANGFTTDLAPVLDIDGNNGGVISGSERAFSTDPAVVAEKAEAFAQGLTDGGITPTFKHFPGLGFGTGTNGNDSDHYVVHSPALGTATDANSLKGRDLKPYETVLPKFPNAMVMMSNETITGLDDNTPAGVSAPAVNLLRNDYKFAGVITTDDLNVPSVSGLVPGGLPAAVAKALAAGVTRPLFVQPADAADAGIQAAIDAVKADPAALAAVDAAVAKTLTLKSGTAAVVPNSCCPVGGSVGTGGPVLTGGDIPTQIYNYLTSVDLGNGKKFTPFQAAAIMGNLMQESSMNPAIQQDGSSDPLPKDNVGFGLAQWTHTDRQKYLVNLAKKEGVAANTAGPQLDYLVQELHAVRINDAGVEEPGGSYGGVLAPMLATTTLEDASNVWYDDFEQPGKSDPSRQWRIDFAKAVLAPGGPGNGAPGGGTPTAPGSGSNCVGGGNAGAVNCTPAAGAVDTTGLSETRKKVVCVAQAELAKWVAGSLVPGTGYKEYSEGRGENWCADFSSWVFNQSGYPIGDGGAWNVPMVVEIKAIGEKNEKFHYHAAEGYAPRPGDLVIHLNGGSHVNIVVAWDGSTLTMIGGNQSAGSFDESKVTQVTHAGSTGGDITGYVSPDN